MFSTMISLILYRVLFLGSNLKCAQSLFFDELLNGIGGNAGSEVNLPNTGSDIENLIYRSCYVCHGTSVSAVTSSCWETVNEGHKRFVSVQTCFGACSITVLNQTRVGLVDYTRKCEPDCVEDCQDNSQSNQLCKYCCYGDRCNNVLPNYVVERHETTAKVSKKNLRTWLGGVMAKPRHHSINPSNKIAGREFIVTSWRDFGVHPEMQQFSVAKTVLEDKSPLNYRSYIKIVINGYNIICTIRGRYYGTLNDRIIVVIAHYDTHVQGTPGVDDNASGLSSLLEISRLLLRNETCRREYTIMLVATDFSEEGSFWDGLNGRNYTNCIMGNQYVGLAGSSHFVCGYLLPHLRRTGSRLMFAVNIHSVLNYDDSPASQSLENFQDFITGQSRYTNEFYRKFENEVAKRRYVGDWVLASYAGASYNSQTSAFSNKLSDNWKKTGKSGIRSALIEQHIPLDGSESIVMQSDDCLPFSRLRQPLSCISLTDTGKMRGYMKRCCHNACDDLKHVTDNGIRFLAKITQTVWRTVEELSGSTCLSSAVVRGKMKNRKQKKKKKKTNCDISILKEAAKLQNTLVRVTATCRYKHKAFMLCNQRQKKVWGLINGKTAWIPKKSKRKRSRMLWFQIDLGRPTNVTALTIQGVKRKGYIRSFRLSYSNNGRSWNWYIPHNPLPRTATDIKGASNSRKPRKRSLNPPVVMQHLRLHPRKWKRRISLRLEVHGCEIV